MKVKTRFAPSPTGWLHIGGLRTALFSYLFSRRKKGKFMMRLEDTDQERYVDGGAENMIRSLRWAGITIDEGVDQDSPGKIVQRGSLGPYIQSERLEIYRLHINELVAKNNAYFCFCSKQRLEELRKNQENNKQPTGYDGLCRSLSKSEINARKQAGETYVIRMKMPKTGETKFTDLVRGEVVFNNILIDDQVLLKCDGFPTYHLASVVDDHLMEVTHVIRGEEWLSSTPKHIMLYEMFGWKPPKFAHLSLLVNEKKQKLSKRHGDVSVEDFIEKGYLPEALINFVAFLGWNPGSDKEIFTLNELEQAFSLEKVAKSPAVFNREKLDWYNKQYIMKLDLDELTNRMWPLFVNANFVSIDNKKIDEFEFIKKVVSLERERAATLQEIVANVSFIFAETLKYESELLIWKKSTRVDTKDKLAELISFLSDLPDAEWTVTNIENSVKTWLTERGYATGDVLWPMRVALSGQKNSPGPFEIADVLGREKTLKRLKLAVTLL